MVAPTLVMDIEMADADSRGRSVNVSGYNSLWCLYRMNGIPQMISMWDVRRDDVAMVPVGAPGRRQESPAAARSVDPRIHAGGLTVVICTRDRPAALRRTLESLGRQSDTDFDVLVVENAPSQPSARDVVRDSGLRRCRYTLEPTPGLSRARNRGLRELETDYVAWLDDDETADASWIYWLKQGFSHVSRPDAVCGPMLPAELETEAQVRFEQYGGFNKGRDLTPVVLAAGSPAVRSPLYPLPSFGAGGNMAFRVEPLRSLGCFDIHLGAGTRTHGGEETQVLARLLLHGSTVLHWPPALTWHTHRRTLAELERQFYGYSAGLSAFYVSVLKAEPRTLIDIARLVPQGLMDFAANRGRGRTGDLPYDFPPSLLSASRRGLLSGAPLYLIELAAARRRPRSPGKLSRQDRGRALKSPNEVVGKPDGKSNDHERGIGLAGRNEGGAAGDVDITHSENT